MCVLFWPCVYEYVCVSFFALSVCGKLFKLQKLTGNQKILESIVAKLTDTKQGCEQMLRIL